MEPFGQDVEHSFRTSRKRQEAVIMLSSMGEAYPAALARAIGVHPTRLHEIMNGKPPAWSIEDAPLALRLAEYRPTARGHAYFITPRGRQKARQWTSRQVRAEVARRAKAEWARGRQMDVHVPAEELADGRPPVRPSAVSSFTVTFRLHNP